MATNRVRATRSRRVGEARRLAWAFRQEVRQAAAEARDLVEDSAIAWDSLWAEFDAIASRYED